MDTNSKCETEVYSRVTGFYRPVQDWNRGKKSEYNNRKPFDISEEKEESYEKGKFLQSVG